MSDTVGVQIAPGRFATLGAVIRRILDDDAIVSGVVESPASCARPSAAHVGERLPVPYPDEIHEVLLDARNRLERASAALVAIDTSLEDAKQRKLRAQMLTGRAIEGLDAALGTDPARRADFVEFVSGTPRVPAARDRPARRRPGAARRGVERAHGGAHQRHRAAIARRTRSACAPGTFDLARCRQPVRLPAPRPPVLRLPPARPAFGRLSAPAVHDELAALITAAGGRTLALFTSWRAMDARRGRGRRPRRRADPHPARPARSRRCSRRSPPTRRRACSPPPGFFQGVDVPGSHALARRHRPAPVPPARRPAARRRAASASAPAAFREIDLPRAAMLLAQARRTADPHRRRPRRRRRARPPPRHGRLPLGHRQRPAPDAAHPPPRRGRSVPRVDHRRLEYRRRPSEQRARPLPLLRRRSRRSPSTRRRTATRCPRRSSPTCSARSTDADRGIADGSVRVVVSTTRRRCSAPAPTSRSGAPGRPTRPASSAPCSG